jgi:hypothetical protein
MMWKRERDLLIAQTLAFVQSVAVKKGDAKADAGNADAGIVRPDIEAALIDAIRITAPPDTSQAFNNLQASKTLQAPRNPQVSNLQVSNLQASNPQVSRVPVPGEFRAEMQARLANFRKHQERFHRDRDEYYSTTLARLRAAIGNDSAQPPPRNK